ncbi:MAG: hypothetical protein PHQ18_04575 [Patescibacteria group bacterium]|nr:hypothetical protein [Patescibacteria group bacterium]
MKRISFIIASLALVFFVTGCSNNTSVNGDSASTTTNNKTGQFQDPNMPERNVDISGVVKSMVGNEVTITQIDMEKIREKMMESRQASGDTNTDPAVFVGTRGTGMGPGGGMMGGMGGGTPPGEANSEEATARNEMMAELTKEYSLGDVKVIIPVGIAMNKRGEASSLADVIVGSNLSIWLNTSVTDKKVAEYVSIR